MKPCPQGAPAPTPDDLIVLINSYNLDFDEFIGTRAMLEAEGLIPNGTVWPQGYDSAYWQAGPFDYLLRRQRPPGAKGPSREFVAVDWFCLRQELKNPPSPAQQNVNRKLKELADAVRLASPKGKAERDAQWSRYWVAEKDDAFQAFKSTIPGLVQKKRGRPCKTIDQAQGATA